MKKIICIVIALLLLCPAALADSDPLLYRVTDGEGNQMYLFGTVHIGREDMYPLSQDVLDAFAASDALAVEADVTAEMDAELYALYMEYMYYPDGDCLSDHFSEETMDILVKNLTGYPRPLLDVMRPIAVQSLVEASLLAEYPAPGVDETLIGMAREHGMEVLEVEGILAQLVLFPILPDSIIELSILSLLEDPETGASELASLVDAWVAGDAESLTRLCLPTDEGLPEEYRADYEEFVRLMYTDRNRGMCDQAASYIASGKTVFMAVGTAHLLGEDGLVALLQSAGYTVERI